MKGVNDKGSTTRSVTLRINAGVRIDDLPHELRVAGGQALVVVRGRAPQCLRCSATGHMRRDCKVPRCTVCRRFGHEATQCVRSNANLTGPVRDTESTENIMDEQEAEETAAWVGSADAVHEPVVEPAVEVEEVKAAPTEQQPALEGPGPIAPASGTPSEARVTPGTTTTAGGSEVRGGGAGDEAEAVAKRPRKDSDGKREGSGDAGNVKAAAAGGAMTRRPSFKPKPNTPYDRGPASSKPP